MILCTIFERIASIIPKNVAINKTTTTTTAVPPSASLREGQVTLLTSAFTSARNSKALVIITLLNIQVSTGQEGFEPPTLGFGIRCSTVRATDLIRNPRQHQEEEEIFPSGCPNIQTRPCSQPPNISLFGFLMGSMLSAKFAVFL